MTHVNEYSAYSPEVLPPAILRYLDAQKDSTARRNIADVFAPDARVVDEGVEYVGIDAIRGWLATAASEFVYTTTFVGQREVEQDRWVILARLEGNFPGGVADVRFQIARQDDQIVDLVIAP